MGTTAYQEAVGKRLRALRAQRGWSLRDVEELSRGKWPAVVIGSYERGDRAINVQKLSELAGFYGVSPSSLLPDGQPDHKVERLADALVTAGLGSSEFAYDLARRLVLDGVAAPKTRKAGAA